MTIKNTLLARRHSLLATVTERSWRSRIQTHEKSVYQSVFKWFFRWLHPDLGVKLAQYLSVKNKLISGDEDVTFLGEDNEWLILYSKKTRNQTTITLFLATVIYL
jgi:hypothetical protein